MAEVKQELVKIYLLEDINDVKYVGQTKQKMYQRLSEHRNDKKRHRGCSSSALNLYNTAWTILEEVPKEIVFEREAYWIDYYDTVNTIRNMGDAEKRERKNKRRRQRYLEEKLINQFLKLLEEY